MNVCIKRVFFLCITLSFLLSAAFAQTITTIAGDGLPGFSGDNGPALHAALNYPGAVTLDDSGNLYISDTYNWRIRKISPDGTIATIVGDGLQGYSGDGGLGSHAEINSAFDIAADHRGNIYIADAVSNCIRKVMPDNTITSIAGNGLYGYNGDNIPATGALLNHPTGITVDKVGNIYIVDALNYLIRKIDTAGIITTVAGIGIYGYSPDGSRADTAMINAQHNIRVDDAGNLFFMDNVYIRKIDTAGIITTVAGYGLNGYSGDGGPATSAQIGKGPLALDNVGNIYMVDSGANRIRMIDMDGIIHTIAGDGLPGFLGDGGNPLSAEFYTPQGIAIGDAGDIYIADAGNHHIRLITNSNNIATKKKETDLRLYPNPSPGTFMLSITTSVSEPADVVITDILSRQIKTFTIKTNALQQITLDILPGTYYLTATTSLHTYTQQMIIR